MPRRRVGRREAEVSKEHASEDRLIELYIEHCMPPPPWIRWDPSHMLGLEWKLAVLESRPSQYSPVELSRLRCADEWDTLTGGEPGRPLDNNAAFEYSGRRIGGDAPYVHQLLHSPPPAGASDFSDPLPEWDSPEWRHFCKCPHEWTISGARLTLHECMGLKPPGCDSESRDRWMQDVCMASHPNDWGWLHWLEDPERWSLRPLDGHDRVYILSEEHRRRNIEATIFFADRDRAKFAVLNALRGRAESAATQIRRREAQLASVRNELIA